MAVEEEAEPLVELETMVLTVVAAAEDLADAATVALALGALVKAAENAPVDEN